MTIRVILVFFFAILVGFSYYLGYTPVALAAFFSLSSILTYMLYARDKAAAMDGSWRISENTLHVAGLLFGWPGALIARQRLRHKTKKQSFIVEFWITVLLNLSLVVWIHTSEGNAQLRQIVYKLERNTISSMSHRAPVSVVLFLTKFRTQALVVAY